MTPPIVPGKNGMSTVLLSHPSGSSADIYLNGAHVTSWIPAGGKEVLFMGKTATFAPGDPIRGGIPVVFPQFANTGPLPQHGFARKAEWQLAENGDGSEESSSVKLVLTDDHKTRELWNHHFRTELVVTLGETSLEVKLQATNTGDDIFSFTAALHTYLAVADIRETALRGLTGKWYLDKTQGGIETKDEAKKLVVSDEIDRVYLKAPKKVEVEDRGNGRRIEVRAAGFKDAVVWNPWVEKVTGFIGLDPEDYLRMICVEAAQIGSPVELKPGISWSGAQTLAIV
ncbi:MAG TPA: D-hexose-6-phosphate mutarotase [Gemmatimonadaceae bacterium]|nr:D-hexose-6-phosphate mutarotase [Gemmatimonadaceae bacterium]